MNKIFKSPLLTFILGIILTSSVAVFASGVLANNIGYHPEWKKANGEDITNVEEALDELYNKSTEGITKVLLWENENPSASIGQEDITLNDSLENYSHILVQWHPSTSDNTVYEDIYSLNPSRNGNSSFYSFTVKTNDSSFTRRINQISNTSMRIQTMYRLNSANTNSSLGIPVKIYGLNLEY